MIAVRRLFAGTIYCPYCGSTPDEPSCCSTSPIADGYVAPEAPLSPSGFETIRARAEARRRKRAARGLGAQSVPSIDDTN